MEKGGWITQHPSVHKYGRVKIMYYICIGVYILSLPSSKYPSIHLSTEPYTNRLFRRVHIIQSRHSDCHSKYHNW